MPPSDVEPINPEGLKELLAPYQTEEGGLPKGEVELDWVLKVRSFPTIPAAIGRD